MFTLWADPSTVERETLASTLFQTARRSFFNMLEGIWKLGKEKGSTIDSMKKWFYWLFCFQVYKKNAIQILQHWSSCSFTVFPLILLLSSMHVYIVLSNSLCMQCSVSLRVAQQRIVDSHFSYNSCSFCRLKDKQRTGFFLNFSISLHIFSKQKK